MSSSNFYLSMLKVAQNSLKLPCSEFKINVQFTIFIMFNKLPTGHYPYLSFTDHREKTKER